LKESHSSFSLFFESLFDLFCPKSTAFEGLFADTVLKRKKKQIVWFKQEQKSRKRRRRRRRRRKSRFQNNLKKSRGLLI